MQNYQINLQNLLATRTYNVTLYYSVDNLKNTSFYVFNKSLDEETETLMLNTSLSILKT